MCDPITLGLALGAGALGATGAIMGGRSTKKASDLQMQIAEGNAAVLGKQAEAEEELAKLPGVKARLDETRLGDQVERVLDAQTARFGARGIDATSASPLLIAGFTAAQAETDKALIQSRGALEKASALSRVAATKGQIAGATGQALGFAQKGDDALIAGYLGAGTALLTGAAKAWPGLSGGPSSTFFSLGPASGSFSGAGDWS